MSGGGASASRTEDPTEDPSGDPPGPLLVLMRHAEQEPGPGDAPDQAFTAGDRPLGEAGRRQARAARDLMAGLELDAVYCSPMTRCRQTADVVAKPHGLKAQVDRRFVEVPFVEADVLDYETVMDGIRRFARGLRGGGDPVLAGGVRFSQVRARVVEGLADVLDRHESPLVVAHGGVNRIVLARALAMEPARMFELGQGYACVNVLAAAGPDPWEWEVLKLNVDPLSARRPLLASRGGGQ